MSGSTWAVGWWLRFSGTGGFMPLTMSLAHIPNLIMSEVLPGWSVISSSSAIGGRERPAKNCSIDDCSSPWPIKGYKNR